MPQFDKVLPTPNTVATVWLRLTVTVGKYDASKNRTPVSWNAWLEKRTSAGYPYGPGSSATVHINGVRVLNRSGIGYDFSGGTTKVQLGSGVTYISGSVQNFPVTTTFNDGANVIGSGTASGTVKQAATAGARGPRVNVGGVWKPCIMYVKVNDTWKQVIPYVKVDGKWKNAGG